MVRRDRIRSIAATVALLAAVFAGHATPARAKDVARFEDGAMKITQELDERGALRFTFVGARSQDESRIIGTLENVSGSRIVEHAVYSAKAIPVNLARAGFEVTVDGQPLLVDFMLSKEGQVVIVRGHAPDQAFTLTIKLQDHVLGSYRVDPVAQKIKVLTPPERLSRFDLRQMSLRAGTDAEAWKQAKPTIARDALPGPSVDLHTHYRAALTADKILEVAQKNSIPYPTALLDRLGIKYKADAVVQVGGVPHVPVTAENLGAQGLRKLRENMELPGFGAAGFRELERVYDVRAPLLKNKDGLQRFMNDYFLALAEEYKAHGIRYAELSSPSEILSPEWLEQSSKVLPDVERRTGVRLRFLLGLRRTARNAENIAQIEKLREAMRKSPYIVGVDFLGEELNPTSDFLPALRKAAELKAEFPAIQIRVHAGENPRFLGNVREAIENGATRIGHGLYGVDEQTLKLARDKGVIIEFNMNSNLALNNIDSVAQIPLKRYIDAGVRVTLASDGHGVYQTTPASEVAAALESGLTPDDLLKVYQSDREYVVEMNRAFDARRAAVVALPAAADAAPLPEARGPLNILNCLRRYLPHFHL